ncbi:hypothetical protein ACW2AV_003720 [Cronobacter sakazakii]|uniref:hypothetical protein n=1 Tax=Cronobacter sakazakii TaxID=28141 RepID=UPI000CF1B5FE|nr:hypothetical protein [Cronobacter sakazakii]ELQ6229654.1 hypothetical protein [Cronobacter dublinensis]EIX1501543.1 hypothetical protein [Cronobacter sakazakii]EIX6183531.1 hypothetical protein [Cronobacter sakazakii]EIX6203276.1 hypothetical protein [Cronobacter sakazakii]EIX6250372.1 hypothetical protein [Cronobacter sakazakii]
MHKDKLKVEEGYTVLDDARYTKGDKGQEICWSYIILNENQEKVGTARISEHTETQPPYRETIRVTKHDVNGDVISDEFFNGEEDE